ncbi:hypothetical protein THAOC_32948 [Thalassiosira oceanica]|uniref:Uncharacterized protein n=1 Tax=Thalassiosira oceanica TaxID=159749 RepID=K0RNE6_THAOC|nr:hypothetical protein THAOC_32948 [Thalassiosira oceanica]|mmetsp:Transcript_8334/g.17936  ORF Transcript_8334/g.17936 Transcript_8334/m.17936 type:complete len:91 (-) Transcript_8334:56-328(-)|eukprot:EJK48272.1 hypothetical protein THAOC_32948 [Thalassiosira oceanica]
MARLELEPSAATSLQSLAGGGSSFSSILDWQVPVVTSLPPSDDLQLVLVEEETIAAKDLGNEKTGDRFPSLPSGLVDAWDLFFPTLSAAD